MKREDALLAALTDLRAALEEIGASYMLIGGLAVIARGVARLTRDVDATVWAEGLNIPAILSTLARHGIVARVADADRFARTRQVLLLRHGQSETPLDISLGWLPFERAALNRADTLDLAGIRVPVARAEDLIVYKAVAWRARDRDDIERLLVVHGDRLDLGNIRRLVAEFASALDEPERVSQFDLIVERALRSKRE
jgi:predicted nucleotidyltransferase